jgi:hypothetical protein
MIEQVIRQPAKDVCLNLHQWQIDITGDVESALLLSFIMQLHQSKSDANSSLRVYNVNSIEQGSDVIYYTEDIVFLQKKYLVDFLKINFNDSLLRLVMLNIVQELNIDRKKMHLAKELIAIKLNYLCLQEYCDAWKPKHEYPIIPVNKQYIYEFYFESQIQEETKSVKFDSTIFNDIVFIVNTFYYGLSTRTKKEKFKRQLFNTIKMHYTLKNEIIDELKRLLPEVTKQNKEHGTYNHENLIYKVLKNVGA